MATKYEIRSATGNDMVELAMNMREPDIAEVWAAGHHTPMQAAHLSLAASRDAQVGLADGKVVCIFGVGSMTALSSTGVPWLLATNELDEHARVFLRMTKYNFAHVMRGYEFLRNHVDVRNKAAIRWLGWLGFRILPAEPFGIEGLPFHPFEMRLPSNV